MIFRKSGCLVVTSNLVKLKSISSWPKNIAKTTKMISVFIFTSNDFRPWKIEEREKESKKIADVAPIRRSQERDRERKKRDDRTSPTIAPDRRSHQSDSNAAQSRLRRTISPSPPPIEPSRLSFFLLLSIWPDLMNFFAGFCFFCEWVWNWFIFHMFTTKEVYWKLGGLAM